MLLSSIWDRSNPMTELPAPQNWYHPGAWWVPGVTGPSVGTVDHGGSVYIMWTRMVIFTPPGKVQCNADSTFIESSPQPTACQNLGGAQCEGHIWDHYLSSNWIVPHHFAGRCTRFWKIWEWKMVSIPSTELWLSVIWGEAAISSPLGGTSHATLQASSGSAHLLLYCRPN